MTPCVISLSIGGKGKVEARSRSARCGRREKGQCGRTVEAIEQPITAPASSHFGSAGTANGVKKKSWDVQFQVSLIKLKVRLSHTYS